MFIVQIQLVNDESAPYVNHRVAALLTRKVSIEGETEESSEPLWVPAEISADVSEEGIALLSFPDKEDMTGDICLRVMAPDGEILHSSTVAVEELEEQIEIAVNPKSFFDIERNTDPAFGKPAKTRGRVIDATGRRQIANKQIVLWGSTVENPEEDDFQPLVVATTDVSGYFSGSYPVGQFTDAYGVVGVGDNRPIPIRLENEGDFPKSVILVVTIEEEEDQDICGKIVPRDPDSEDLTTAEGTFSSDLGVGRCVDFNKPNRTLEEFSFYHVMRTTEPQIKGITLEEPPKIPLAQLERFLALQYGSADYSTASASGVAEGSGTEAASPAKVPSIIGHSVDASILKSLTRDAGALSSEARLLATVSTASMLTVHQDLVRFIGEVAKVAPGRSSLTCKNPVDWDHEPTIYQTCTIAHGHLLHFKQEWVADGFSLGDLLYSLPLAPCQKKQIVVMDWERRESAARFEELTEQERLAATLSRDRDINEIVNTSLAERTEGGSQARTSSFGGGLFGGIFGIGGGSSKASSRAWQTSSRRATANSLQQLRDRTAQAASAIRSQRSTVIQTVRQGERVEVETEVVANYNHCHAMTVQYFEVLRHLLVRQRLVDVQECLFVPLLMSRFTADKALRWRESLNRYLRNRRLRKGFAALERIENNYVGSDLPVGAYADEALEHLEGDLYLRFQLARPRDSEDGYESSAWSWMERLLSWMNPQGFYNNYLKDQAHKDRIFQSDLAPRIAENFVNLLRFYAVDEGGQETLLPIDPTLVSSYRSNRRHYVSLRLDGALPALHRKDIKYIKISYQALVAGESVNLSEFLPANSKVIVESGRMRYRTKYLSTNLFRNSRIANDLTGGDDVRIYTPLSRQEMREPREEDQEVSRQLLAHLNEHIEYYHRAIWWSMSPARRYMLLDGFVAPNSNGRSVASVVENRLVGIVGNCLVMPVSLGNKLDPTYNQDEEEPIDLLDLYQPNTPIEPIRIAIPTKGVFAEAVMGACNSCEYIEEDRFWRWEESPCPDSPTAIQPISTESRRAEPPDMTAKDFPTPMINLQNAPAAPDPTGLAAALQLLGTPNLFRDITGLTENQRNALAAFQAAQETAQFFGGQAADLVLQGKMNKDIDKAIKTIKQARKEDLVTDEQARTLTEGAIRASYGAGAKTGKSDLVDKPEIKDLVKSASEKPSAKVVLRRGSESVDYSGKSAAGQQDCRTYVVQPGDTLTEIAARFGVTVEVIVEANGIADPNLIIVGQVLMIP
jgi:LysM repeat protein